MIDAKRFWLRYTNGYLAIQTILHSLIRFEWNVWPSCASIFYRWRLRKTWGGGFQETSVEFHVDSMLNWRYTQTLQTVRSAEPLQEHSFCYQTKRHNILSCQTQVRLSQRSHHVKARAHIQATSWMSQIENPSRARSALSGAGTGKSAYV